MVLNSDFFLADTNYNILFIVTKHTDTHWRRFGL